MELEPVPGRIPVPGRLEGRIPIPSWLEGRVPVPGLLEGRVPVPGWLEGRIPVPGRLVETGSGSGTMLGREKPASRSTAANKKECEHLL